LKLVKRGLIFEPGSQGPWAASYATVPTAFVRRDSVRIYFASLDHEKRGRVGYIDVDRTEPSRVLYVHPDPVLDLGETGTFDDSGVNPSCVLEVGDELWMYYIGWQRCERVPYMLFSGLAKSSDHVHFARHRRVPVLDRTDEEPFSRSAPFVLKDGPSFRMWYWSCREWSVSDGLLHYNNVIRHATSPDGIAWTSDPTPCVQPIGPDEYAVGRPWVIREGAGWRMWFSIRSFSNRYTIGYAQSRDGITWERLSDDVLARSSSGWDSEMVCYPSVVDVGDRRYLFYNGNRHGASGFGFASIER
jgi:predicted GH43/DUF377 family glycosyl hydrolase